MKRLLCLILTATLIFAPTSTAFAKPGKGGKDNSNNKKTTWVQNKKMNSKKHEFTIKESPVIKYGRYKLPTSPVTKGMGASLKYDKKKNELKTSKGNVTLVIDFKNQTVTVNGVTDTKSNIFDAKDSQKMTVLLKYIAEMFGCKVDIKDDNIKVEAPGLDYPTKVTITPVGGTVVKNTLNSTNLYLIASAKIKPGQATGGKAELYVGSRLIATDSTITATDDKVTFTTGDDTPTNEELRAKIPEGGEVTVRLYNAENKNVSSQKSNPTLVVDYTSPTINKITSATYNPAEGKLNLTVAGAGAVGDKVDVSKISIYDSSLGKSHQLTNHAKNGSNGVVKSESSLEITLGHQDLHAIKKLKTTSMHLIIANSSLLTDAAGNSSPALESVLTVPVTVTTDIVSTDLAAPTNITITPVGTKAKANTLNSSTLYVTVSANIIAGQATGGKAELYVGSRLVATDTSIGASDTQVTFTTSDNTPTNEELQRAIPEGGVVSVKLYNSSNQAKVSSENPTLTVDYSNPSITEITSAVYDVSDGKIYLIASGLSKVGDIVDVTKISIYDSSLGRSYQLMNHADIGSSGTVYNANTLLITLGTLDKKGISAFGNTGIYINIGTGSLLSDAAGNSSPDFTQTKTIELNVIP